MLSVAHLCFPNYTEACYLTDTPYQSSGITEDEARCLIDKLRTMGSKTVLITSIAYPENGTRHGASHFVAGFDGDYFTLEYDEIPVHFPGTGDIFSAIVDGHLLAGDSLKTSARIAMDTLSKWIEANKDNKDKNRGIPLEHHLGDL